MRTAIICGSGFSETGSFVPGSLKKVTNEYGQACLFEIGNCILLPRHGVGEFLAPHQINNRANLKALADRGTERIVCFNSVGSLSLEVMPGTIVVPNDVFCPWRRDTFFDEGNVDFKIPAVSCELNNKLVDLIKGRGYPVREGGVYCQTLGPTFETVAEIKFLESIGLLVGMTFAQEVFLASELEIPIASICMVDNFANGISPSKLVMEELMVDKNNNKARISQLLEDIIDGKL